MDRKGKQILRIEIEGTVIQKSKANETYVDAFNLLYKRGLINDSIVSAFSFVKKDKSDFKGNSLKLAEPIEGSKNLWVTTHSGSDRKYSEIKQLFDKYKIAGKVDLIDNNSQAQSPQATKRVNEPEKTTTNEITATEQNADTEESKPADKKPAINDFRQAICILGDSGVGKSVRIKKTLENAGHEKLIVIIDSLWSHLLFDYIPETRKYELTKIGEFIARASKDAAKHYTIVIDECHKNIEIINDSLLQAISTNRNNGVRFLSLNTFGDKLFDFLPHENGNRLLPDNLGFVFISSKRDVIIEGNPDLKNRVDIIELTKDDWQDKSHDIEYLLAKIKKEEPGEYTN